MGREIRRVVPNWEHPRYTSEDAGFYNRKRIGQFKPLFDRSFREAMAEWWEEYQRWEEGERPDYFRAEDYPDGIEFWDYSGPAAPGPRILPP